MNDKVSSLNGVEGKGVKNLSLISSKVFAY